MDEDPTIYCKNCHGSNLREDSFTQEIACHDCGFCYMDNLRNDYVAEYDENDQLIQRHTPHPYDVQTYALRLIRCCMGLERPNWFKTQQIIFFLGRPDINFHEIQTTFQLRKLLKKERLQTLYIDNRFILNCIQDKFGVKIQIPPLLEDEMVRDIMIILQQMLHIYHGQKINKKKFLPLQFTIRRILGYINAYYFTPYQIRLDHLNNFKMITSNKLSQNEQVIAKLFHILKTTYPKVLRYPMRSDEESLFFFQ